MATPDERQEPVTDEFEDDIHGVPSHTPDFRTELAEELARLVPEAVADGKIDFEKLRELLDEDAANDGRERFGLMWPGKSRALKAAQAPTTATLVPDRENSKDWDTTQNVFIEGDNLEVLKILQKHYHGKIKLIYIDPPYNTGNDFIYPDNYKEGLQTYLEWTKQVSEDGKKLSSNPESAGRYHSNWLNMMYPRLKLARNLLTEDGLICASIDGRELPNLTRLFLEVFGEANFLATLTIVNNLKGRSDDQFFATANEYLLVAARDVGFCRINGFKPTKEYLAEFDKADEISRYKEVGLRKTGKNSRREDRPNMYYPIYFSPESQRFSLDYFEESIEILPNAADGQEGCWRWGKETFTTNKDTELAAREVNGRWNVYVKMRDTVDGEARTLRPKTIWLDPRYDTASGARAVKNLFDGVNYFDNPKPVDFIKDLVSVGTGPSGIVLDFFSGSGTTAEAVMRLNAEDGGSRCHIQVQLPEPVDPESEAAKAGFGNIADIARERIRRAGQQIYEELGDQLSTRETPLDVAFRSYKLADTSFVKWRETSSTDQNALEERLAGLRGSADDNATPEMLLAELLLKQGYSLTENLSETEIAGLKVWSVADGAMLAIMDEHVKPSLEQLRAVVEAGPVRLVILEDVFAGDDQLKTNLVQHAKTHGVELWSA